MRQKILTAGIEREVHALSMAGAVLPDQVRQLLLIEWQIFHDNQMQKITSRAGQGAI